MGKGRREGGRKSRGGKIGKGGRVERERREGEEREEGGRGGKEGKEGGREAGREERRSNNQYIVKFLMKVKQYKCSYHNSLFLARWGVLCWILRIRL